MPVRKDNNRTGVLSILLKEPLYWLLAFIPAAAACEYSEIPGQWTFLAAAVAIIPLAGLMGRSTENIAEVVGPGLGGLLNATLGNAAELIIALFALWKGPAMYPLVKASITGSIVGNILLVLGLSILAGGIKYERQQFNATAASMGATLLGLAAIGLIIPAIFFQFAQAHGGTEAHGSAIAHLSEEIALILLLTYGLSLFFSLKTHRHLFAGKAGEPSHPPEWSIGTSLTVLFMATAGVAWMAEMLVGAVEPACLAMGMNSVFVGVIVVAIVGNAAEHSTAVLMALKNKMDLSVNVAIGSGIQVALLVAPLLVFASIAMGNEQVLDLHFSTLEVITVAIAVVVLGMVASDGETHWMEGVMLLAVYLILAVAYFNLPITEDSGIHPPHGN